jgi:hypothetical protein
MLSRCGPFFTTGAGRLSGRGCGLIVQGYAGFAFKSKWVPAFAGTTAERGCLGKVEGLVRAWVLAYGVADVLCLSALRLFGENDGRRGNHFEV